MEWATVLLSGVVAGSVSALVSWTGGLHRDIKAAEHRMAEASEEATRRREDTRREHLADALAEFLAGDRRRFEGTRLGLATIEHIVESMMAGDCDEEMLHAKSSEALAGYRPYKDAAANAAERIRLYALDLDNLVSRVHAMFDASGVEKTSAARRRSAAQSQREYQGAVAALVASARAELGIVVLAEQLSGDG